MPRSLQAKPFLRHRVLRRSGALPEAQCGRAKGVPEGAPATAARHPGSLEGVAPSPFFCAFSRASAVAVSPVAFRSEGTARARLDLLIWGGGVAPSRPQPWRPLSWGGAICVCRREVLEWPYTEPPLDPPPPKDRSDK